MRTLTRLANMGVTVAIDDFGTGYSAIGYLLRMPANVLKIDQSLTAVLLTDPRSRAIVQAVIGLCTELDVDVVVEGVETPEIARTVFAMGARYGQGLLFGPALSAWELMASVQRIGQTALWATSGPGEEVPANEDGSLCLVDLDAQPDGATVEIVLDDPDPAPAHPGPPTEEGRESQAAPPVPQARPVVP